MRHGKQSVCNELGGEGAREQAGHHGACGWLGGKRRGGGEGVYGRKDKGSGRVEYGLLHVT